MTGAQLDAAFFVAVGPFSSAGWVQFSNYLKSGIQEPLDLGDGRQIEQSSQLFGKSERSFDESSTSI